MARRIAGVLVMVAALAAALAPVPAAWVEVRYSRGWYPPLQRAVTTMSNVVPFALVDVLLLAALLLGLAAVASVARATRGRRLARLGLRTWQTAIVASLVYLWFVAAWGANYRRLPMTALVEFDRTRVTTDAVVTLNDQAVAELQRLRPGLPTRLPDWPDRLQAAAGLVPALERGTVLLGLPSPIRPGRPKTTVLDAYFTRAGVSGMTNPFLLETLLASNLLPYEVPAVMAHEWGHLAGLARESDASFFGLLVCLHGDATARYSAWLEIFGHTLVARGPEGRREALSRLPEGVRADLRAMAERSERDQVRLVRLAAWRTYDSYLRSQRVESGVRNYDEVVRLLTGTRFREGWEPVLARSQ